MRSYESVSPAADGGGEDLHSTSLSPLVLVNRACVIFQLGLLFLLVIIFPILLSLKADGSLQLTWTILWTPVWILDGFMVALVVMSALANDFSERLSHDYENIKALSAFISLPLTEPNRSKIVYFVKTVLFIVVQILVIFKIDGRLDPSWDWIDVFAFWILYEAITIISLVPAVCEFHGADNIVERITNMLLIVPLSLSRADAALAGMGGDEDEESSRDSFTSSRTSSIDDRRDLEPIRPIRPTVVAINLSDVGSRDSSPNNSLMQKISAARRNGSANSLIHIRLPNTAVISQQIEKDESIFEDTLSRRIDQNGFLVCMLRIWLALALSLKLDDTANKYSWTATFCPVWIYVASQYFLAYTFRTWAKALLRGLKVAGSGAEMSPVNKSRFNRGSRLLATATAGCAIVTIPLIMSVAVVLRLQEASFALPLFYVVFPIIAVLSCCICRLWKGEAEASGGEVEDDDGDAEGDWERQGDREGGHASLEMTSTSYQAGADMSSLKRHELQRDREALMASKEKLKMAMSVSKTRGAVTPEAVTPILQPLRPEEMEAIYE